MASLKFGSVTITDYYHQILTQPLEPIVDRQSFPNSTGMSLRILGRGVTNESTLKIQFASEGSFLNAFMESSKAAIKSKIDALRAITTLQTLTFNRFGASYNIQNMFIQPNSFQYKEESCRTLIQGSTTVYMLPFTIVFEHYCKGNFDH